MTSRASSEILSQWIFPLIFEKLILKLIKSCRETDKEQKHDNFMLNVWNVFLNIADIILKKFSLVIAP